MRAGLQALRFQELVLRAQLSQPFRQLRSDPRHGPLDRGSLRNEVGRRVDRGAVHRPDDVAGQGIDLRDALDLIPPEFDPHRLLVVCRKDFHRIPTHAERPALEADVVALILDRHEIGE